MKRFFVIVVLFFANSPMIPPRMINKGIKVLQENPDFDTAFSAQYDTEINGFIKMNIGVGYKI